LLIFLGYYGYQRLVKNKDILMPVRIKIHREFLPALRQAFDKSKEFFSNLFAAPSEAPEQETWEEYDEDDAVSEPPPEQEITEVSESESVEAVEAEDPEFLRILQKCQEQSPKVGDSVSIKLKGQQSTVDGILQRIDPDSVVVKVEEGTVVCPRVVMEATSRLTFSPREHARKLFEQRQGE
ncbi:hypothetical protein ACFLQR_04665, partial [Verrucomicrobiota bacterium]